MKKCLAVLLLMVVGAGLLQTESKIQAAKKNIVGHPELAVLVDGRKVIFQGGDPVMEDGRVQVPLRGIGDALGAEVKFDGTAKEVIYTKSDKSIVLTIGSKQAMVDGKAVTMDAEAKAVKGRTYVPLRFVSENLGESVSWDQAGQWVWIGSKEVPNIADVTELEDLSAYRKYFKNDDEGYKLLKTSDQEFTKVRIINKSQLPIQMGNKIIYDIDLVKDEKNTIQVRYKGGYGLGIYLLTEDNESRERVPENGLGESKLSDGTKIANYYISFIGDKILLKDDEWKKFSIKDVEFICFRSFYDEDSVHLLANPFK
ncbi:copper amine oxidase N-terminal domain-containing protein [Paenibacillus sp. DYY-L-2]|uniref:copper amine oxidase N-terminal domain-containing protein n=1 Tax=Paenibacillus sp. DYY-L-2 TaxID=3447013 RepID=UPI003F5044A6